MTYCTAYPYMGETIRTNKPVPNVLADSIIERSLQYFDIPKKVMFSKIRRRNIVEPRQMIMVALSESTRLGVLGIGKMFNRDHATVIHAKKVVRNLCETDPVYRVNYNEYVKFLNRERA